jgi:hypothetical protein
MMNGFRARVSGAVLTSIVLLTSGMVAANAAGLRQQLIKYSNTDYSGEYTFRHCKAITKQPFDLKASKRKVLIIGDSQACDFYNGAVETGNLKNYQVSLRYIPYSCQPTFDHNVIAPKDRPLCAQEARVDNLRLAAEQIKNADVVIFAARWKQKAARALPHTLKYLKLRPNQRVIVLGNKNFGKISIRNYLRMSPDKLLELSNDVPRHIRRVNAILKEGLTGTRARFIDQQKVLCDGSDKHCEVFTNNHELISYDGWHLTEPGARYAGTLLFRETMLRELR